LPGSLNAVAMAVVQVNLLARRYYGRTGHLHANALRSFRYAIEREYWCAAFLIHPREVIGSIEQACGAFIRVHDAGDG
jgi:hypothetical protein